METNPRKGLIFAAITALTWSTLAIVLKYSLNFVASETIVWFRFVFAAISTFVFFAIFSPQKLRILIRPSFFGLAASVCLAINYYGYMKAVELTSPSNAQILIQMAPMLLIISGIVFFRERPSRRQYLGFILAFTGFAFFFRDQITMLVQNHDRYLLGNLWVALAALTWAIFASLQKILTRTWTPQEINLLIYVVSTILLFPTSKITHGPEWTPAVWFLMCFLGANTLLAYGSLGYALKNAPASQVSVIITMNPLLTLLFMKILEWNEVTWIAPERISWLGYLGALLVISGIILVIYRKNSLKTAG